MDSTQTPQGQQSQETGKATTMMNACYKCIHRRSLPGDAHSRCAHPSLGDTDGIQNVFAMLLSARHQPMPTQTARGDNPIAVTGNENGIRMGWFNWPYNFDPVWLKSCEGFSPVPEGSNAPSDSR